MGRKRYVSTNISIDPKVRQLAQTSEFAALLYTWMIPHADDGGCITADCEALLMQVVPGFRWRTAEDVATAVSEMVAVGLVERVDAESLRFPGHAFYKYQAYIGADRRSPEPETPPPTLPAQNGAERRKSARNGTVRHAAPKSAQNPTSSSSSSSLSVSSSSSVSSSVSGGTARRNGAPPNGNPRIAALKDAFRARGLEPAMGGRDYAAVKQSTAPPGLIAETYLAVADREYGDDFMRKRLSVHEAVDWVNGYCETRLNTAWSRDEELDRLHELGYNPISTAKGA